MMPHFRTASFILLFCGSISIMALFKKGDELILTMDIRSINIKTEDKKSEFVLCEKDGGESCHVLFDVLELCAAGPDHVCIESTKYNDRTVPSNQKGSQPYHELYKSAENTAPGVVSSHLIQFDIIQTATEHKLLESEYLILRWRLRRQGPTEQDVHDIYVGESKMAVTAYKGSTTIQLSDQPGCDHFDYAQPSAHWFDNPAHSKWSGKSGAVIGCSVHIHVVLSVAPYTAPAVYDKDYVALNYEVSSLSLKQKTLQKDHCSPNNLLCQARLQLIRICDSYPFTADNQRCSGGMNGPNKQLYPTTKTVKNGFYSEKGKLEITVNEPANLAEPVTVEFFPKTINEVKHLMMVKHSRGRTVYVQWQLVILDEINKPINVVYSGITNLTSTGAEVKLKKAKACDLAKGQVGGWKGWDAKHECELSLTLKFKIQVSDSCEGVEPASKDWKDFPAAFNDSSSSPIRDWSLGVHMNRISFVNSHKVKYTQPDDIGTRVKPLFRVYSITLKGKTIKASSAISYSQPSKDELYAHQYKVCKLQSMREETANDKELWKTILDQMDEIKKHGLTITWQIENTDYGKNHLSLAWRDSDSSSAYECCWRPFKNMKWYTKDCCKLYHTHLLSSNDYAVHLKGSFEGQSESVTAKEHSPQPYPYVLTWDVTVKFLTSTYPPLTEAAANDVSSLHFVRVSIPWLYFTGEKDGNWKSIPKEKSKLRFWFRQICPFRDEMQTWDPRDCFPKPRDPDSVSGKDVKHNDKSDNQLSCGAAGEKDECEILPIKQAYLYWPNDVDKNTGKKYRDEKKSVNFLEYSTKDGDAFYRLEITNKLSENREKMSKMYPNGFMLHFEFHTNAKDQMEMKPEQIIYRGMVAFSPDTGSTETHGIDRNLTVTILDMDKTQQKDYSQNKLQNVCGDVQGFQKCHLKAELNLEWIVMGEHEKRKVPLYPNKNQNDDEPPSEPPSTQPPATSTVQSTTHTSTNFVPTTTKAASTLQKSFILTLFAYEYYQSLFCIPLYILLIWE